MSLNDPRRTGQDSWRRKCGNLFLFLYISFRKSPYLRLKLLSPSNDEVLTNISKLIIVPVTKFPPERVFPRCLSKIFSEYKTHTTQHFYLSHKFGECLSLSCSRRSLSDAKTPTQSQNRFGGPVKRERRPAHHHLLPCPSHRPIPTPITVKYSSNTGRVLGILISI